MATFNVENEVVTLANPQDCEIPKSHGVPVVNDVPDEPESIEIVATSPTEKLEKNEEESEENVSWISLMIQRCLPSCCRENVSWISLMIQRCLPSCCRLKFLPWSALVCSVLWGLTSDTALTAYDVISDYFLAAKYLK